MASGPRLEFPAKVVFGPFEYNDLTSELRKQGSLIRLRGQPLQTLKLLLYERGGIVTREELQRTLWEGSTFVDFEHGLNAAVNRLRQTLCDSAEQPRYIQTVAGQGYRLIAPIEFVHDRPAVDPPLPPTEFVSPPRERNTVRRPLFLSIGAIALLIAGVFWLHHSTERQKEVYGLELKGETYISKWTQADVRKGISFYNRAIALDPKSASAYTGLASGWNFLSDLHIPPHEAMERAKAAALKAVQLNDSLAGAHANLGLVKLQYDWDWQGAEHEFRRAIDLDPRDPLGHRLYGWLLISQGQFAKAESEMRRGLDIEPSDDFNLMEMGLVYFFGRQNDQAIEQERRAIGVDPTSYWSHMALGWINEQRGDFSSAAQELTEANRLSLEDTSQVIGSLGHAYALSGQRAQALNIIETLQRVAKRKYVSPYDFAVVYAGLEDRENALFWLERAYDDRCGWLALWLNVDPRFNSLRTDPRFQKLLRRIGFAT